ncbi:phage tail tape measure protein [Streptomyces sp. NPDC006458]|uniref:phage tail tape measure protein n=1 Tax=Streptomyces sp. NPDC006458 TaxID=3154302 RepID=UPI0033A9288F
MSDTSLVFNLVARDNTEQGLSSARERFDTAAAGIGAGVAAALGAGIAAEMDLEAASTKLAAQLGIGPAEAAELSQMSARVYSEAWGDSTETVNEAIRGVYQNIGKSTAAESGLEDVTTKALALAETFNTEVGPVTAAVGQLVRTGLADSADEAFDIITTGFGTSANKADDLLETLNEYSTQFRRVGLDGQTTIGLIHQGIVKGARDADAVADAIGIFGEVALGSSKATQAAFGSIGLDGLKIGAMMRAGGSQATEALQMTMDALRGTENKTTRLNAAQALFGDLANTQADALFALDPASAAAASGMDKATGSTDKLADAMDDSASKALTRFKRTALLEIGAVAGVFLDFATENEAVMRPLMYTLLGLAGVVLVVKGAMMVYAAGAAVVGAAHWLMDTAAMKTTLGWLRMNAVGLWAYARIAGAAIVSGAATAAAWTGSALVAIGTWILSVIRAAVVSSVQFAIMAAKAVWWAATMAAQWLIAMGPVGWVIAVVIGLVALVIAKWDSVRRWTGLVWDWVVGKVASAVGRVLAVVTWMGRIPGWVSGWFNSAKNWAVKKALELVGWMVSWPGRINAAIGSMRGLLVSKGMDVVRGLWNGIRSMGGWLRSQLYSFAKSAVPGPIAKALGIASPSKVTRAQGQWIARGLVLGMTGSRKQVQAAAAKLADIIRAALAPGGRRTKALAKADFGTERLLRLADREAVVATRLKTATKRLDDLVKARAKLVADVKKGVLDSANITTLAGQGPVSAETLLTNMTDKLAAAKKFAADLVALRKKGVRSDLIAQIAQAGVEGGASAAAALATASKGTISQINSTQAQIVAAAGKAGTVAGDALYGSGIHAAKGLVAGLKAEQKNIENAMLTIALGMQKAIKKALGIKSPSTVLADQVGRWIPPGVVAGMQRTAPQLDEAMRTLVRPELAAPARPLTAPTMAPLMGAQAAGGTARVVLDIQGADSELKRLFRKMVRVDGRGRVQILTGE